MIGTPVRPNLMVWETFIEKPCSTGTCYKAARWHYLGDTRGCGTHDTLHRCDPPIKGIRIYPLARDFRQHLYKE